MKRKVNKNFVPFSSKFGIPGVSYQIQLGTVNGKWTLILIKGRDVIASQAYEGSEFPRSELISAIISLNNLPNFYPNQIKKKDVETWVDQAIKNYREKNPLTNINKR